MAIQKFYFHDANCTVSGTLPTGEHSAQTAALNASGNTTPRTMDATHGSSQASASFTTASGTAAQRGWFRTFVSAPLSAQSIPAGNWQLSTAALEANANSNLHLTAVVYAWRPSTGAVVGSLISDFVASTGEPGTSETAINDTTIAGGAVDVLAGDVLVCEIWRDATTQQSGSSTYNNQFFYDGTTEASAANNAGFLLAPVNIFMQGERGPTFLLTTGYPQGAGAGANNTTTIALNPGSAVGDVLFIVVGISSNTITSNGVSSSRTSGWTKVESFNDSTNIWTIEIWKGVVTSTGTHTVTVTYTASVASVITEIDAYSFHSTRTSPVWWVAVSGGQHDTAGTTFNMPSLTPSIDGPQAYVGLASPTQVALAGSTALYNYNVLDTSWVVGLYSIGVVGAQTPNASQTPSGTATVGAVIFSDAPIDGSGGTGLKKPSLSGSGTVTQTITAPTLVANYDTTDWTTNTTPKTHSVTTGAGDYLVIPALSEDNLTVMDAPTGGGLTYHLEQSVVVTDYDWTGIWTTKDPTGQTFSLSQTRSGSSTERWGNQAFRFSGATGIGASAKANNTTGGPSLAITTLYDHSAIVIVVGDWNGVDGASRVWRTVNSDTPTAGNGQETHYYRSPVPATGYIAYIPDAGTAGSKTVGLSTPSSGMHWSVVAVEVVGSISGGGSVSGTGSIGLKKPALSVSAKETESGTGSVGLKKPSLHGQYVFQASGGTHLHKPSLSASATEFIDGSGGVSLKKPALSVSAVEKEIGSGGVILHKMSLSASGAEVEAATGSVNLHKMVLSISGTVSSPGAGNITMHKMGLSGSGTEKFIGTGSVSTHKMSLSASGTEKISGTGGCGLKKPGLLGVDTHILRNTAEGETNGATITTGNSGGNSGDAWNALSIAGNGGSLTADNSKSPHNGISYKFVTGSPSGNSILEWTTSLTATSVRKIWFRTYVYFTGAGGTQLRFVRALSGSTLRACLALNTAGKITLLDASATGRGTTVAALPTNQWVRVEGFFDCDASNGQIEVQVFSTNIDGIVPDETLTSAHNLNTGGEATRIDFGNPSSVTSFTHWMDEIAAFTGHYIGPDLYVPGTGSIRLKKPSLSVSAKETETGTGSVHAHKMVLSGSGNEKFIGTGSVSLHKPVIALAAPQNVTGTGSCGLKKPHISASGNEKFIGTGSAGLKKPSISLASEEIESGTGSVHLHKMSISASGSEKVSATGSVHLHKMSIAAAGPQSAIGTGSVHLHKMSISASAFETIEGSGGVTMNKPHIHLAHGSQPANALFAMWPV